ncbi:TPR repeat-containing protein [Nannocystis exedens]|uniref:TPR repeat-containing protein n=1 Tax=Nannocystis exedens TaxID=54 RepID=A0A1I2I743_9BACT|nr:tetratricopeptide repeat protein [Nannocystis exedens]PCC74111.1 Tetratricopeptide repeat protein [Nannocystis exedens]SFF38269.1 TPR repeat-containing protein [Nannocystis exedens]
MTKSKSNPSTSTPGAGDPVGPKHAKLLSFLATRGQVEFDAKQVKRGQQLLKQARAELLGPLPKDAEVAIFDGWVRRVTLKCSKAVALWPEIAAAPALGQLEEIELLLDDGTDAWIEAANRQPLRVTRFHLNGENVDPDTGEILDERENSARVVAAANALAHATELVLECYVDPSSSLAGLDLPALTSLWIRVMTGHHEPDAEVLATLKQARLPQLRRLGWESSRTMDPAAAVAVPAQITELGFWGPNEAAVLPALVAARPSLTAIGVSTQDRDDPEALDDDALRRLGEGKRLFGPRCSFARGFNTGFRILHALDRDADGLAQFAALRGRNSRDADVHFQYGNAIEDDLEAVNAFCEALLIDPDHGPAHCNLGSALVRLGRWRPAIYHLERYLEIHPSFAPAWRNLAKAHRELGEEEAAQAAEANLLQEA